MESKTGVQDLDHGKSLQSVSFKILNYVPLSLRIARMASSCLLFFNIKARSRTKTNVSPLSSKKNTQAY
jgi:hypothetical protein